MKKQNHVLKESISWLLTVVLPVAVVFLINLYVCKLAVVSGDSMYPTLFDRDLLVVWMLNAEPACGDVVVVNSPEDSYLHGEKIVKRVIATGGQTVSIDYEENAVYVDGVKLDEPYLNFSEADPMAALSDGAEVTVPEGCYYVLGDNRNHSGDSRNGEIGFIAPEDLVGIQIARIPLGRWNRSVKG